VAKFQLFKARQHGERVAEEKGFTTFPVDPFAIAESEGMNRTGFAGGSNF
jgi:hypothetical protein